LEILQAASKQSPERRAGLMLDGDVGLSKPTGIRHQASGLIGQHGAYFGFQQALSFLVFRSLRGGRQQERHGCFLWQMAAQKFLAQRR